MNATPQISEEARRCAEILRGRGVTGDIGTAVVLGTGLGAFADAAEDALATPYADLPGFPHGGVSGHAGRLVTGVIEGRRVALLQGRAHYYERGDARAMAVPLETLAALGVRTLVLTNAAGSLHVNWPPGSIAALSDHINFSGMNPLIGASGDDRFVPMTGAYDAGLRARLKAAAASAGVRLNEGVYMWFSGPSFETPAEIRMARALGADLVGMSTVPEVILARRLNMRVAALSLVTNYAAGLLGANPSHAETKDVAAAGGAALALLLRRFLRMDHG